MEARPGEMEAQSRRLSGCGVVHRVAGPVERLAPLQRQQLVRAHHLHEAQHARAPPRLGGLALGGAALEEAELEVLLGELEHLGEIARGRGEVEARRRRDRGELEARWRREFEARWSEQEHGEGHGTARPAEIAGDRG